MTSEGAGSGDAEEVLEHVAVKVGVAVKVVLRDEDGVAVGDDVGCGERVPVRENDIDLE